MIIMSPDLSDIQKMPYTDFIALIQETNRCPGGKDSIRRIIQNTFLTNNSHVLEIGSNTGFTSLELARSVKCEVEGIDVSASCIKTAGELSSLDDTNIKSKVHFQVGSAYDIPFPNNSFDLTIVGGATSFMDDKKKAVDEYFRVTKPWGFIAAIQLYYHTLPPKPLLRELSALIGVEIKPWLEADWIKVFKNDSNPLLELYSFESHRLTNQPEEKLDKYINYFLEKPHLKKLSVVEREAIKIKWRGYLNVFNENHKYLNYFIAIFRKRSVEEEPELFTREQAKYGWF
jgi:ubiquinone/menaquinone biosynthesis C-methylase UbiE